MAKISKRKPHPKNRKQTASAKVRRTAAKVSILASSPVSRTLSDIFGDWGQSRLGELAARIAAEPFDLNKFRAEIMKKLDRAIPRNRAEAPRISFSDRLKQTDSLATVLHDSTLQELRKCLLIPTIFDRDRTLERKRLSAAGLHLRFHRKQFVEARARMREIEKQAEIDGTSTDTEEYRRLDRQFKDNIILLILSTKHPGSRKELLSIQPARKLRRKPRRKTVAAKLAAFWVLRTRLNRNGASDSLIHQLCVLISAPPDGPKMSDDELLNEAEALKKAIADNVAQWKELLPLP